MPSFTLRQFSGLPLSVMDALDSVALDDAETDRRVTVKLRNYFPNEAAIAWQLTHNAATDVQVAAEVSLDGGTTYNPITSRSILDGTGTVDDYTDVKDVSGDDQASLEYALPAGTTHFRYTVSGTSGGSSDVVSSQVAFR